MIFIKNKIPVGNIYYMLSYAFKDLQEESIVSIKPEEFDNIYELMAEIIIKGISYQLKKGLLHNYESHQEASNVIRGKINFSETLNNEYFHNRKIMCIYDEYTENTVMNRILKSIMLLLIRSDIKSQQAEELCRILRYFCNISEIDLFQIRWELLTYNRNNSEYRLLMGVCRIICENMLHSTEDGDIRLVAFFDKNLNRLYEKFILNYYIKHYPYLKPNSSKIKWATTGNSEMLPKMQSDIVLSYNNRKLIIDAKLYTSSTHNYYGYDSFHSHNLYQIFTYVKNEDMNYSGSVSGMLLYAKTKDDLIPNNGVSYDMSGNIITVKSLDLSGSFEDISNQLNNIAENYIT